MPNRSVELREEAKAKHAQVAEIIRLIGEEKDFSKAEVLEKLGATDSKHALEKFKALNVDAHELFQRATEAELDEDIHEHQDREQQLQRPKGAGQRHPEPPGPQANSLGSLFLESKAYKETWLKQRQPVSAEIKLALKTLLTTSAGFAPERPRSGDVVPFATRPVQILDLIPVEQTNLARWEYMEKTTYTVSAVEIAEAATYPESTYVWTARNADVKKIADSLPVTDEQLDDVGQMMTLLDQDLRFGVRQKLDSEVLVGPGTGATLTGITNASGIQTQARGTDPHFDAIFKAITKVRAVGRGEPDAIAIHSTDWQTFRLMRTADGLYIMGNPAEPGDMRLFGIPVVSNEVLTVGTALVGDFGRFSRLYEKAGIEVQIGFTGTQFTEGKKTLRAQTRVAFIVRRGAAFCTVTGL